MPNPTERNHLLLTTALVRNLPAPATGNKITYDDPRKGVAGFGVRITAAGYRSFILNYRTRSGRERRLTIGSFPVWPVSAAREKATELRRRIDDGDDPLGEREALRAAPTLNDAIARWRADYAPRRRAGFEAESLIAQWIAPELGNRKVADIRRAEVDRLHRKITETGTPVRANRAIGVLSRLMNLAVRWEWRADNPASGIERNDEPPRHRYLSADELRRLIAALNAHPTQQAANVVRLALLTGARRREILSATWSQFDLKAGVWTKPASSTKQARVHRVPLSTEARHLLTAMRAQATSSPFLFPSPTGPGPLISINSAWKSIRRAADLQDLRLHDLRHSYASILASAGLSLPIIGQLLGHSTPGVTARYAHLHDAALKAATEHVGTVVGGAKILPLKRGR